MSKNILRHIDDEDFLEELEGIQRIRRKPKTKDEENTNKKKGKKE